MARKKRTDPSSTEKVPGLDKSLRILLNLPETVVVPPVDFTPTRVRRTTLDVAKAQEYLNLPPILGERIIRERDVQDLVDKMQRGRFNASNVLVASVVLNGVRCKCNAQHTCRAVLKMQDIVPGYELVGVIELLYAAETVEDAQAIYASFDAGAARTESHLLDVHLTSNAAASELSKSARVQTAGGIKFWAYEDRTDRSRAEAAVLAETIKQVYTPLFVAVGQFYVDMKSDAVNFRRHAVMGAMCATFDKCASKAPEFWKPVGDGVKLPTKTDPRLVLRKLLTNMKVVAFRKNKKIEDMSDILPKVGGRYMVDPEILYRVCIACWNKWREGKPCAMLPIRGLTNRRVFPR